MKETAQRIDLDVYNEACAFSVADGSAIQKKVKAEQWDSFYNELGKMFYDREAIVVELYQDDSLNVRILGGDELRQEETEWVGKATGVLNLPQGKLLVAGGFDPDALAEHVNDGESEYVHEIEVPPGAYKVDIYTYLNSINGEACLPEGMDDDAVVEWFKKEHPGRPLPRWMEWMIDPDEDKTGLEDDRRPYIDFLIHLTPNDGTAQISAPLADGFLGASTGKRQLAAFPQGVRSHDLERLEGESDEDDERKEFIEDLIDFDPEAAADIRDRLKEIQPQPLQGGPVACDITDLPYLWYLGWFCDPYSDIAIFAQAPAGDWLDEEVRELFLSPDGRIFTGVLQRGSIWLCERAVRALTKYLVHLPDGATLELASVATDRSAAGSQIYRGPVKHSQWLITETFPELKADQLAEARALCLQIGVDGPLAARDKDELRYVREACKKSMWVDPESDELVIKGLEIGVIPKTKAALVMMFFRNRFRGIWDVTTSEQQDYEQKSEWQASMDDLASAINTAVSVSRSDELVFQGAYSTYYRADITKAAEELISVVTDAAGQGLNQLNQKGIQIDPVVHADKEMKALGFKILGDMVCEAMGDVIMRGYGHADETCYGVFMLGAFGQMGTDFYTAFTDGSSQTTTTTPARDIPPDVDADNGIYRRSASELTVEALYMLHLSMLIELTEDGGRKIRKAKADLEFFAEAVDAFLQRQFGVA